MNPEPSSSLMRIHWAHDRVYRSFADPYQLRGSCHGGFDPAGNRQGIRGVDDPCAEASAAAQGGADDGPPSGPDFTPS